MHSRRRGTSGSKKPVTKTAPSWVEVSKEDAIELVLKLAKEGKAAAEIGLILRDAHGIPSFKNLVGKTISQILEEKKASPNKYPDDLIDLIRRAVRIRTHLRQQNRDKLNKFTLAKTESKIRRLVKYYRGRKLPEDWKYEPEKAALLVK